MLFNILKKRGSDLLFALKREDDDGNEVIYPCAEMEIIQVDVKAATVVTVAAAAAEDAIEKAAKAVDGSGSDELQVEKRLVNIRALHPLSYTLHQLIIIFVCKFFSQFI